MDETGSLSSSSTAKSPKPALKAANQGAPDGAAVRDCKGLTIVPGLVDMRVFIGEPGAEHRETIASASRGGGGGRRDLAHHDAGHRSGDRRRGAGGFRAAAARDEPR
jgi:hypothetical protein